MRISGIEPTSVILSQRKYVLIQSLNVNSNKYIGVGAMALGARP